MNRIDEKYPQFIRMDEERKTKFLEPLVQLPNSLFIKRELGEVYFMAVALGFKNKIRVKSNKSKEVRTYQLLNDRFKLLIRIVILVSENFNYEILKDGNQSLKIIEEYANGGVQILYDKICSNQNLTIEEEIWNDIKSVHPEESA